MPNTKDTKTAYAAVIQKVFFDRYVAGGTEFEFKKADLVAADASLGTEVENIPDIPYQYRYRYELPPKILATQTEGLEWFILGRGKSKYAFVLAPAYRIVPNPSLSVIKVPDATPEIIARYARGDEKSLLAKLRYNRLVDVFLGTTAFSLQSHLRTTVKGVGQIEIDELYVAVDKKGRHYIVPLQAKGGRDKLSVVQTQQDLSWAGQRFPELICRPISAQFMEGGVIALFELVREDGSIKILEERHYRLVSNKDLTSQDLDSYRTAS
jgi:hypothetical protein